MDAPQGVQEQPLFLSYTPFSLCLPWPSHGHENRREEDGRPEEMESNERASESNAIQPLSPNKTKYHKELTCDIQVERDLLAPGLAAVLPGIRLARLLHHQPPGAALGFHTHFRA